LHPFDCIPQSFHEFSGNLRDLPSDAFGDVDAALPGTPYDNWKMRFPLLRHNIGSIFGPQTPLGFVYAPPAFIIWISSYGKSCFLCQLHPIDYISLALLVLPFSKICTSLTAVPQHLPDQWNPALSYRSRHHSDRFDT
jgi:hypothetical protein